MACCARDSSNEEASSLLNKIDQSTTAAHWETRRGSQSDKTAQSTESRTDNQSVNQSSLQDLDAGGETLRDNNNHQRLQLGSVTQVSRRCQSVKSVISEPVG